jgi:predicted alpha/beta-hydrolase family hydrolase
MFEPLTLPTTPPTPAYLHRPAQPNNIAVALTHGAGANSQSRLLISVSDALAAANFTVFRFNLPFRQLRPHGPPHPATAAADREGIRQVAEQLKLFMSASMPPSSHAPGHAHQPRVILAGHSYGGRQASMLLAESPEAADALLLLSYPLHPPNKPTQLRTKHFPQITKPALFVQGTRDPFATIDELSSALKQIPARHQLLPIENAAHDLQPKKSPIHIPTQIAAAFERFFKQ